MTDLWSKRLKLDTAYRDETNGLAKFDNNYSMIINSSFKRKKKLNKNNIVSPSSCTTVFGIPLILQNLSHYLSLDDLKKCRLVSKQWNTSFTLMTPNLLRQAVVHLTDGEMRTSEFGRTTVSWKNFDLTIGPSTLTTLENSSSYLWFYSKLKWTQNLTLRFHSDPTTTTHTNTKMSMMDDSWKFELRHMLHLKWILGASNGLKGVHLTDSLLRHLPSIFFTFGGIQRIFNHLDHFTLSIIAKDHRNGSQQHNQMTDILHFQTILDHPVLTQNVQSLLIKNVTFASHLLYSKIRFPRLKTLFLTLDSFDCEYFMASFLNGQPPLSKIELIIIKTMYHEATCPPPLLQAIAGRGDNLKSLTIKTDGQVCLTALDSLWELDHLEEFYFDCSRLTKNSSDSPPTLLELLNKLPSSVQKISLPIPSSLVEDLGSTKSMVAVFGGFDPLKFTQLNLTKFCGLDDIVMRVICREFRMLTLLALPTYHKCTDFGFMGRRMEDEENTAKFPISDLKNIRKILGGKLRRSFSLFSPRKAYYEFHFSRATFNFNFLELQSLRLGGSDFVTNDSLMYAIKFPHLNFLDLSELANVDAAGVRWALGNNASLRLLKITCLYSYRRQCPFSRAEVGLYFEKGAVWRDPNESAVSWTKMYVETGLWHWREKTFNPYPNLKAFVMDSYSGKSGNGDYRNFYYPHENSEYESSSESISSRHSDDSRSSRSSSKDHLSEAGEDDDDNAAELDDGYTDTDASDGHSDYGGAGSDYDLDNNEGTTKVYFQDIDQVDWDSSSSNSESDEDDDDDSESSDNNNDFVQNDHIMDGINYDHFSFSYDGDEDSSNDTI